MDGQRIALTQTDGLRFQGSGGRRVIDSWDQIDALLRQRLTDKHAALFSEPVAVQGGSYSWFGPDGSDVRAYDDLSEADQSALREKFRARYMEVRDLADTLKASPNPSLFSMGETIERALNVPSHSDDDHRLSLRG